MAQYDYDLITIGAGSGGVRATRMSAKAGARCAVVEESRYGGTCVIRGCVPKKLFWYAAHFADDLEDATGYGWELGRSHFHWPELLKAKNKEIQRLEGIYQRLLRESGVEMLEGHGKLIDGHTVAVDGKTYTAERILIATGGRPAMPDVPGIEHAITSNEARDLPRLPRRMVVVGGGYIAVEFAGVFNSLGVDVTQVLRADNLLRGFDQDVRTMLADEMKKKGVDLRCESVVRSIEKREDGALSLRLAHGEEIEADTVLYATGRRPNTDGLGLEEVGVETDARGAIVTDEYQQTSVSSVFALGDVTDRINLTPVAIGEGMGFADTQFGGTPRTMDYTNVPSAVFSHPPIGSCGLTEVQAREVADALDVYVSDFRPMRHTLSGNDERAMMKLIVDRESQKVLGLHMVGMDAPEITQGFAVAMKLGATKQDFDRTVGIHPTAAEEFVTMRDPRPDPSDTDMEE